MIERLDVLVGRAAGRADAADRVLEERVAGEDVAVDGEVQHPGGVAGRVDRVDEHAADVAAARTARRSSGLARRDGRARRSPGSARLTASRSQTWSWWWWVSSRCVTSIDSRSAASKSGSIGPPASTRNPGPPVVDADEVGVRQEASRHGSFDEHAQRTGRRHVVLAPSGYAQPCRAHPHLLPHRRHRPLRRLLRGARLRGAQAQADPRRGDQRLHGPARRRRPARADLQPRRRPSTRTARGYNHIAITVPDMDETLAALAEQGIEPEKPPYSVREGGSLLCFVRDPDGYRIEIIERRVTARGAGPAALDRLRGCAYRARRGNVSRDQTTTGGEWGEEAHSHDDRGGRWQRPRLAITAPSALGMAAAGCTNWSSRQLPATRDCVRLRRKPHASRSRARGARRRRAYWHVCYWLASAQARSSSTAGAKPGRTSSRSSTSAPA